MILPQSLNDNDDESKSNDEIIILGVDASSDGEEGSTTPPCASTKVINSEITFKDYPGYPDVERYHDQQDIKKFSNETIVDFLNRRDERFQHVIESFNAQYQRQVLRPQFNRIKKGGIEDLKSGLDVRDHASEVDQPNALERQIPRESWEESDDRIYINLEPQNAEETDEDPTPDKVDERAKIIEFFEEQIELNREENVMYLRIAQEVQRREWREKYPLKDIEIKVDRQETTDVNQHRTDLTESVKKHFTLDDDKKVDVHDGTVIDDFNDGRLSHPDLDAEYLNMIDELGGAVNDSNEPPSNDARNIEDEESTVSWPEDRMISRQVNFQDPFEYRPRWDPFNFNNNPSDHGTEIIDDYPLEKTTNPSSRDATRSQGDVQNTEDLDAMIDCEGIVNDVREMSLTEPITTTEFIQSTIDLPDINYWYLVPLLLSGLTVINLFLKGRWRPKQKIINSTIKAGKPPTVMTSNKSKPKAVQKDVKGIVKPYKMGKFNEYMNVNSRFKELKGFFLILFGSIILGIVCQKNRQTVKKITRLKALILIILFIVGTIIGSLLLRN